MVGVLNKIFKLDEHQTTVSREAMAGLTTFLTTAYIIFINPKVLGMAGMDKGAVFTATCIICAISTFLTGIYANNPIAIVPGMALNTFFAYIVVLTEGYNWQNTLGMVFISGVVFLILTATSIRRYIINALPGFLNVSILTGIGILLGLIALKTNHVVVVDDSGVIHLGNLASKECSLFAAGFLLILILDYNKVPGTMILGILIIAVVNFILEGKGLTSPIAMPPSAEPVFMKLQFDQIDGFKGFKQVFSFVLIALFDATGTILGLLKTPLFEKLPSVDDKVNRSLVCDSVGTIVASVFGSSSTSPAIESASGIEAGGRTGLTSVVVSLFFVAALYMSPLVAIIPDFAVGAAILYIACCLMKSITELEIKDITDFAPSVLIIVMIPFSFSVADGIGVGLITFTLLKLLVRDRKELNTTAIILSLVFLYYFIGMEIEPPQFLRELFAQIKFG